MNLVARILGLLTGAGGIPEQLRLAYQARLNAANDAERIEADREFSRLSNRLATSDNVGLRIAIAIISISMAAHVALVAFVSSFPQWGWTVHALPAPMNEWEGSIIMSLFGLAAVIRVTR